MIIKRYFTFEELLKRWKCEPEEIHYLILNEDLVPSIAWDDFVNKKKWFVDFECDGNPWKLSDAEELDYLSAWVYLRKPIAHGPSSYSFVLATVDFEDVLKKPWYRLLKTDGQYRFPISVTQERIESNAVFMRNAVEDCELTRQPKLSERVSETELPRPKTEEQNQQKNSDQEDLPASSEKPLGTTERRTLLVIIAALCKRTGLALESRGAAGKIARLTEDFGAPVSEDRVSHFIKKIPDAVESRMK